MTTFQQVRPIDTLQPPYHLFRRDIEKTILPFAREHGIGVLVYGPLAHGLLSGRMTTDTTFAADDWRSTSDLFTGEAFRRNLAVVRDLTDFAARRDATVAQLAIAWTLANPAVDVAIVGARSAGTDPADRPGADLRLTPEDMAQIESDAARRGRRRRPCPRSDAEELTHDPFRKGRCGRCRDARPWTSVQSRSSTGGVRRVPIWRLRPPGRAAHAFSSSQTRPDLAISQMSSAGSPCRARARERRAPGRQGARGTASTRP